MNKRTILSALAVTSALALSACGGGGDPLSSGGDNTGSSGSQIIVGSADFTESQLIGSIYSQALQAAGVDVKEQFNIGSREVYIAALKDGSIDLVPEYSGALLKLSRPEVDRLDERGGVDRAREQVAVRDLHVDAVAGGGQRRPGRDEGHRR